MIAEHLLLLSAALFCIGLYGVLTRRNAIAVLIAVELILNAANLNFVAFAQAPTVTYLVEGHVVAIFVIGLAACEAVVGLAIIIAMFRHASTIYLDRIRLMRG